MKVSINIMVCCVWHW